MADLAGELGLDAPGGSVPLRNGNFAGRDAVAEPEAGQVLYVNSDESQPGAARRADPDSRQVKLEWHMAIPSGMALDGYSLGSKKIKMLQTLNIRATDMGLLGLAARALDGMMATVAKDKVTGKPTGCYSVTVKLSDRVDMLALLGAL